ncbi:conserved hypothetical protein [Chlorobaculum parvum NCIB 8327]|uniref:DUF2971 domain-containing protein n=2 Tax=Chlorobaculum parvum TaxID=274539 RepID=B3QR69_CHLP8|nr:conserved hypothetical protein [Chlorobaculum parvum NCIB 8327]
MSEFNLMSLLYKFRPAEPLSYLIDILLEQRLYCSKYEELNDPFEGQFIEEILDTPELRMAMYAVAKTGLGFSPTNKPISRMMKSVTDLPMSKHDDLRICSLTSTLCDVRMWSLYASGHKGVAFELDFSGLDINAHQVIYEPALKKWSTTLMGAPSAEQVLTRKTEHWTYEQEYRIFARDEYVSVANRIRRVILGARATPMLENLVRRLAGEQVEVVRASLDVDGVRIPN